MKSVAVIGLAIAFTAGGSDPEENTDTSATGGVAAAGSVLVSTGGNATGGYATGGICTRGVMTGGTVSLSLA